MKWPFHHSSKRDSECKVPVIDFISFLTKVKSPFIYLFLTCGLRDSIGAL